VGTLLNKAARSAAEARFAPLGLFAILIGRLVGIGAGTLSLPPPSFPVSCS
jgi:hypothetical protein